MRQDRISAILDYETEATISDRLTQWHLVAIHNNIDILTIGKITIALEFEVKYNILIQQNVP